MPLSKMQVLDISTKGESGILFLSKINCYDQIQVDKALLLLPENTAEMYVFSLLLSTSPTIWDLLVAKSVTYSLAYRGCLDEGFLVEVEQSFRDLGITAELLWFTKSTTQVRAINQHTQRGTT